MEVKLSQRQRLDHFSILPKLFRNPTNPSQDPSETHILCLKTWANTRRSLKKHFRGLKLETSKGQDSTKHSLVHVVKEGETLTSISKQYGVSVYDIAIANKDIEDTDLVFNGQQVNIPVIGDTQVIDDRFQVQQKLYGSLNKFLNQTNHVMLSPHRLPYVKRTGYFLVLVPLVAFCVGYTIVASYTRVSGALRHGTLNKSEGQNHEFRNGRWKSALGETPEPDTLDADSSLQSDSPSEDQEQISSEEMSQAYKKLEDDYQKFLSQCGLSKWGYWRGGNAE